METYEVHTDLNPEALTDVTKTLYLMWLEFAVGKGQIGGRTLEHPSGRYAASISWKRTGASSVAIIQNEQQAPEGGALETGTSAADILGAMLGQGKTYTDADGYQYRNIPLKGDAGPLDFNPSQIRQASNGESIPKGIGKMWATSSAGSTRFRTMSDRPGAAAWQVPPMAPFAPAQLLSELVGRAATLAGG